MSKGRYGVMCMGSNVGVSCLMRAYKYMMTILLFYLKNIEWFIHTGSARKPVSRLLMRQAE